QGRREAMQNPPDRDVLGVLHERFLRGDRLASEELVRLLLPFLLENVGRRYRRVDEQFVFDGVIDALMDYCLRPQTFDSSRGAPLDQFLALAARRNVDNLLRGESRRKKREQAVGGRTRESDVALDPVAGNIHREERQQQDEKHAAMLDALED